MQDQEMSSDSSKYPNSNNDSPLVATSAQSLSGTALNNNQSSTTSSQALLPPSSSSSLKTQQTTCCSPADKNFVLAAIEPTTTSPQQLRSIRRHKKPSVMTFSRHRVSIQTCCGVLELTWMKALAVLGMVMCAFTFFVLLALLIFGQNSSAHQDIAILVARSEIMLYQAWIDAYTLVAAYSHNASYMSYYNNYKYTVKNLTNYLFDTIPRDIYNVSYAEDVTRDLEISNEIAATLIANGNFTQAVQMLTSDRFLRERSAYGTLLDSLLHYILTTQQKAIESSEIAMLTSLIYLSVALAITVPAIAFILGFAINRDGIYQQRLQRARAIELQDTMNNPKLKALFKKHCIKELNQENFDFLEQVDVYKKLCEHLFELVHSDDEVSTNSGDTSLHSVASQPHVTNQDNQITLQIPTLNSTLAGTSSNSLSTLDTSKKRQRSMSSATELGNEIEQVEARKYSLVKDIYNTFLDVNGMKSLNITKSSAEVVKNALQQYEDKTIHSLSDSLFDSLERDISITLLDSHFRFKQSMDFLKEMKIKKIHDLKTNNNDNKNHQEKK